MRFPCSHCIASVVLVTLLSVTDLLAGEKLKALEDEFKALVDSSKNSIVTITSKFANEVQVEKESGILSFFKKETELREFRYVNVGTGIIYDRHGYIVTRSSIVLGAESNKVTFADSTEAVGRFVGYDPETGFAILRVDKENVVPARFTEVRSTSLGSWNFMIGNSLGVYPSIAFGVVNGIRDDGMLQLTIRLTPGNNGSPIINMAGEVIGLVVGHLNAPPAASAGASASAFGVATLAYPFNWVRRIADDIIEHGTVKKAWLGVVGSHEDPLPKISEIRSDSPAEKAGLIAGDVIVKFSYQKVKSIDQLMRMVEYSAPGETVPVEYLRGGRIMSTNVQLGTKSQEATRAQVIPFEQIRSTQAQTPSRAQPARGNVTNVHALLLQRVAQLETEIRQLKQQLEAR